jgi:hypothetical protein
MIQFTNRAALIGHNIAVDETSADAGEMPRLNSVDAKGKAMAKSPGVAPGLTASNLRTAGGTPPQAPAPPMSRGIGVFRKMFKKTTGKVKPGWGK